MIVDYRLLDFRIRGSFSRLPSLSNAQNHQLVTLDYILLMTVLDIPLYIAMTKDNNLPEEEKVHILVQKDPNPYVKLTLMDQKGRLNVLLDHECLLFR